MAQKEIYGNRDGERAYSAFHRTASARRFIPYEDAYRLATINLDRAFWIECHDGTFVPIALVETAVDVGQDRKPTTATENLARLAGIFGFLVLYTVGERIDVVTGEPEILQFRVKMLWPHKGEFKVCAPKEYFEGLLRLRSWSLEKIADYARRGDGCRRNHDVPRLLRKIEKVSPQLDFFK